MSISALRKLAPMGKRLLLFGPPGAGKGTHSRRLARDLGIPHIATGEMFREAMGRGTPLGREAGEYIRRGELVPDDVVVRLVAERLSRPDAADGYLIDGFPRTLGQARSLERSLADEGGQVDRVLTLEAPRAVLVERLAGRFTCPRCQTVFNRSTRAPRVQGICDACGAALAQRPDDDEAAVQRRLDEYQAKTQPVLDFFRARQWPIERVDSVGQVDEIYTRIRDAVGD